MNSTGSRARAEPLEMLLIEIITKLITRNRVLGVLYICVAFENDQAATDLVFDQFCPGLDQSLFLDFLLEVSGLTTQGQFRDLPIEFVHLGLIGLNEQSALSNFDIAPQGRDAVSEHAIRGIRLDIQGLLAVRFQRPQVD